MTKIYSWVKRVFTFDFDVGMYPQLIERLRGTPARLEDLVRGVPADAMTMKPEGKWSIQEHAGHLLDLESLIVKRLDEFETGADALTAADMTNRKTDSAGHNENSLDMILIDFRNERLKIVHRLELLDAAFFSRTALHPRLEQPMRVVDLLFFQAEHDDHHLARISEIVRTSRR